MNQVCYLLNLFAYVSTNNGKGYFEGLAVKVIDNMQIFLDNVHIRLLLIDKKKDSY